MRHQPDVAYNWQVSASSAFSAVALQNSTHGATQDTVSGLSNGTYFWRLQAVNGQFVQGSWSNPTSFTVTGPGAGSQPPPSSVVSKGYTTFHPLETMTLNWNPVQGALRLIVSSTRQTPPSS